MDEKSLRCYEHPRIFPFYYNKKELLVSLPYHTCTSEGMNILIISKDASKIILSLKLY